MSDGSNLINNIKYDWDNSLPKIWTEFVEELPMVVPLQLELNNKVDSLRIYPYLIMPYVNNVKHKIRSLK
jgi:hypothetical protein